MVTSKGLHRGFRRLLRFSLVGFLNTLVSFGMFAMFIHMGFHYSVATFAAFLVGMLMGFKLHGAYVFDHPGDHRFLRFVLISLAVFAFSVGIQSLVHNMVNDYVAGTLSAVITIPISFLLNRAFVFHAPDNPDQDS